MNLSVRRPAAQITFVAGLTFAAYAKALSRYFVSEDFTILRILWEGTWWENARIQLTGPWLGISFVPFYRPVSTMVLDLELRLWGVWSSGFLVTHLLIHLLNVALLHRIAGHLAGDRGAVPFASALLFALYPLHPNTVVFIGSFATLFAATACLASFLLFLRGRRGSRLAGRGSWVAFALALGSYEAAVVLPALLFTADLLFPAGGAGRGGRRLAGRHLPFLGILAGYLVLRQATIGSAFSGDWGHFISMIGIHWARFFFPSYGALQGAPLRWTVGAVVAAGTLGSLIRLLRRRPGPSEESSHAARLWVLAVVWILLGQIPFHVVDVTPSAGRFWYFSCGGLGLVVAAAMSAVAPARWRRLAVAAAAVLLAGGYLPLLLGYLDLHIEASRTAKKIQTRLLSFASSSARDGPIFVAGHPTHLEGNLPVDVAQVFHWGLSDATRPPFVERDLRVFPLPRLPRERLLPALEQQDLGPVLRWLGFWLGPQSRELPRPRRRIEVLWPEDGELSEDYGVRFTALEAHRYLLMVLARGNWVTHPIESTASSQRVIEAQLPIRFIESMQRLYHDDIFWWIEAQDQEGRPVAFSEIRTIARRPDRMPGP